MKNKGEYNLQHIPEASDNMRDNEINDEMETGDKENSSYNDDHEDKLEIETNSKIENGGKGGSTSKVLLSICVGTIILLSVVVTVLIVFYSLPTASKVGEEMDQNNMEDVDQESDLTGFNKVKKEYENSNLNTGQFEGTDKRHYDGNIHQLLFSLQDKRSDSEIHHQRDPTHRIAFINEELWAPIYTRQFITAISDVDTRKITFPTVDDLRPKSLLQLNKTNVIMASNQGLFILDIEGKIVSPILQGEIMDLSMDNNLIAVVEVTNQSVIILKEEDNDWVQKYSITALQISKYYYVSMILNDYHIYICSSGQYEIHKYNLYNGRLINSYGKKGEGHNPGLIKSPYISLIDMHGSVLICDKLNGQFQLMTKDGVWQVFTLEGITYPRDFIIQHDHVYILWGFSGYQRITRYTIEQMHKKKA